MLLLNINDPLAYLTLMMLIITGFIIVTVIIITAMRREIKEIKDRQDAEYRANEELRNSISSFLKVIQ